LCYVCSSSRRVPLSLIRSGCLLGSRGLLSYNQIDSYFFETCDAPTDTESLRPIITFFYSWFVPILCYSAPTTRSSPRTTESVLGLLSHPRDLLPHTAPCLRVTAGFGDAPRAAPLPARSYPRPTCALLRIACLMASLLRLASPRMAVGNAHDPPSVRERPLPCRGAASRGARVEETHLLSEQPRAGHTS
jgi:hypothetical protein